MAYQSLLTNGASINMIGETFYSPTAALPTNTNIPLYTTYCFLGKVGPWTDDTNPPQPTQDQSYIKQVFKRIFAVKKLTSSNMSPVIQRIDWTANTVYSFYQDTVDMNQKDINGNLIYNYYVKNKYDQVFKCLWNNNGIPSTVEPYFEPGTYDSNGIFKGSDGYKWKFMYVIDSGKKNNFMDSTWMPVTIQNYAPNPLVSSAGYGDIEAVNITNFGTGYNPSVSPITVTIIGDGTGATAQPIYSNNQMIDIQVTNLGENYTYANVFINSGQGSGATAIAPVSPVGGHGFDPISELGCSNIMYSIEFNGTEGGVIPVGDSNNPVIFHQIGLLVNPVGLDTNPNPANAAIYRTTTDIQVAAGAGTYLNDEIVYQSPDRTLANATFSGTVLYFDPGLNLIYLLNTTGNITNNASLYSNISQTTRTVLSYTFPTFTLLSGYITYIQNMSAVQRSTDGIEQFRFVSSF